MFKPILESISDLIEEVVSPQVKLARKTMSKDLVQRKAGQGNRLLKNPTGSYTKMNNVASSIPHDYTKADLLAQRQKMNSNLPKVNEVNTTGKPANSSTIKKVGIFVLGKKQASR